MRNNILLFFSFIAFNFISGQGIYAQQIQTDSSSQQIAFNKAINLFYTSEGNQSPIFNGDQYIDYSPAIKGNAYFLDINNYTNGNIYFDGNWYLNVKMLYDLNKDNVVVLLFNNFSKLSLLKQKICCFDFMGHHFKNINSDTLKIKTELKSGFYSEPYNRKTEVLVKWIKNIQVSGGGISVQESYFNFYKEYYLKKGQHYYSIAGKSSLLQVLKDKKSEIKKYMHSNNIKFRKNPEDAIVKIATYYDQLTK